MEKVLIAILFLMVFISCSQKPRSENVQNAEANRISQIVNAPAVTLENPESALHGTWNALQLGEVLNAARYRLPSKLIFRDNGSYEYNVKFGNILFEGNGTYRIDITQTPYRIELKQNYPRAAIYSGIFDFGSPQIFRIIFYRTDFLPAPIRMEPENVQIFERSS